MLVPILINTYHQDAFLFTGGHTIFSSEGTTQDDPFTMAMYADNSAAGGNIFNFKWWWDLLLVLGPQYGYFFNETKSWLVVKEDAVDTARVMFSGSDIHITTEGHCYLGGVIGSEAFEQQVL